MSFPSGKGGRSSRYRDPDGTGDAVQMLQYTQAALFRSHGTVPAHSLAQHM